jgi:hypothetical protein
MLSASKLGLDELINLFLPEAHGTDLIIGID